MPHSIIKGVGHYLPATVVTNADLEKHMDTSDEWITQRTGIKERRFFTEGEDTVSNIGAKAARMALAKAGIEAKEVDMIVFATLTPDYTFPGSGVLLQRELGLPGIPCIDVRAQCSGFIYSLSIADQYIKNGVCKTVLVVGSEIQSNLMEVSNRGRNMAVLFGDGAGAAVLQASNQEGKGILSTHLHADGTYAETLMQEHPGSKRKVRLTHNMVDDGSLLPYMEGPMVFAHAIMRFPQVINEALVFNKLTVDDIDLLIPHQANLLISAALQKKLKLPDERVYNNIQKYGNTSSASIPIAMSEALEQRLISEGKLVCLASFGSGFTWASALIRW